MNTIPVVTAMALLLGANAWAKKSVDLSEFDGTFNGSGFVSASGMSYPSTGKAKVAVSKNGSSATVKLSGAVSAGGPPVPWGTTLKLKRNGRLTTSNLIGLKTGMIYPASGKYKLPKSTKLEGSTKLVVGSNTGVQDVQMVISPKGKKKKRLDVKLVVLVDGTPLYTYNVKLTGR